MALSNKTLKELKTRAKELGISPLYIYNKSNKDKLIQLIENASKLNENIQNEEKYFRDLGRQYFLEIKKYFNEKKICSYYLSTKLTSKQKQKIHNEILKKIENIIGDPNDNSKFNNKLVKKIFQYIDWVYYDGFLQDLKNVTFNFKYDTTKKGTGKVAGKCSKKGKCDYTITIKNTTFTNIFKDKNEVNISGGLECHSRLDCLINVIEHEIIHLIMYLCGEIGGHGKIFKQLVLVMFGHTDIRHELVTGERKQKIEKIKEIKEKAKENIKMLNVGDIIRYIDNGGNYFDAQIIKKMIKNIKVKVIKSDKYKVGGIYTVNAGVVFYVIQKGDNVRYENEKGDYFTGVVEKIEDDMAKVKVKSSNKYTINKLYKIKLKYLKKI